MPTLADIYSAIDSAKRKASDFVRNPGTSLEQMVNYANDRAKNYNNQLYLAAQATGAPARGQQPTAEQQAAEQDMMNTWAEAYQPSGLTVWHGSPHIFQRFDITKIGTGEGNQAYGRGLYMAESPDLAQTYANKLTKVNGQAISDQLDSRMQYLNMLKQQANDGDLNAAKNIPLIEKSISDLQSQGSMYKVDLPDTHIRRMLDFDSPLKNQPKPVRNLAKSLGMDLNDLGGDLLAKIGKGDEGKQILQNAGIPGVKYLDAQSRDATKGTRNFVVFDPNHLNILERNSKPIK